ncbi:MAG: AraC family transcriptional regulator [Gammaproteobacteria bacterium]|nr:AraC family transcriptional regulator [Gammaproteobacteria bacterium]
MSLNTNNSVSLMRVRYAVDNAERHGVSGDVLLNHIGLKRSDLEDFEARIPTESLESLLAKGVELSGNEYFWLMDWPTAVYQRNNVLFYVIFSSKNAREAQERSEKFYGLYSDVVYPSLHILDNEFTTRVSSRAKGFPISGYRLDLLISDWVSHADRFCGPGVSQLNAIHLTTEYASRQMAYEKFFESPVKINQPYNELVRPKANLELPNINPVDPDLDSILLNILRQRLPAHNHMHDIRDEIYSAIRQQLLRGEPELTTIADNLAMSPRTLQRKLEELGTSFSQQLQLTRKELAIDYLKRGHLSVTEIAMMLGYQDTSSLSTAFRKWYNTSPTEYRKHYIDS